MIHLDVETYSECDLKDVGSYVYARHPSTDVMVAAFIVDIPACVNAAGVQQDARRIAGTWLPGQPPPRDLFEALRAGHKVKAHNAAFDAEIWRWVLAKRYGWWWPGYDTFLDSMAQAQITNLPGSLEDAAKFFPSADRKDMAGSKLMKSLCRPARTTKNLSDQKRHHTPERLAALRKYCMADVRAERSFSRRVPKLSRTEERIWRGTWEMNRRGVSVDTPLVLRCMELAEQTQARYREQLSRATGGDVETETQRARLAAFLTAHGAKLPVTDKGNASFGKDTKHLIDLDEADEPARQAYDLYETLNKSSVAKFRKMLVCQCPEDGRLRGMFCYSGAGQTGRDAGRLVQLQNLPKGCVEGEKAYLTLREMIMAGCCVDDLELCYGNAMAALSSAIRMCIIPGPGKRFVVADYSAIEGRVLAWMAGEEEILKAYIRGLRMYAVAASIIFGEPYEEIMAERSAGHKKKDQIGKVAELACGYQGSWRAFEKMGGRSLGLTREREDEIVALWRKGRRRTVEYWQRVQNKAIEALNHPMAKIRQDAFTWGYDGEDLKCLLPSGRCLWYRRGYLGVKKWDDGGETPQIKYYGVDDNGHLGWVNTYGGKLTENQTQAVAREIMMDGALRAEQEGWPLVMRVHDELVAEVDENDPRSNADLCLLMRVLPPWAAGLPIDAAGWDGFFYRKD